MIAPKKDENKGRATRRGRAGAQKPWRMWALIGGVAVAMVALVVFLMISDSGARDGGQDDGNDKTRLIDQVEPAAALRGETEPSEAEDADKPLPPQRPHEVRDGMLMLSNGELLPTNKLRKVSIEDRKPRFQYAIFDHATDNELAAILTLKPGQALIGGPIRHKDYTADFMKSIETPIVVHSDDPEDVQEVKRAVIEARLMIKDAIDAGEDPVEIIKNAYEEAQKLALYKDDIRREVMNMAKDGDYTEDEVDDLIDAANKMLESKGIAPIQLGPVMKARLRTLKR